MTIPNLLLMLAIILIVIELVIIILLFWRKDYLDKIDHTESFFMEHQLIDTTRDNLFNTSYSCVNKDGQIQFYGFARPKKGHDKLYLKIIDSFGGIISSPREIKLSPQVVDKHVGEVKAYTLNNELYIYTNFFGKRDSLDIFPHWASKNSRDLYFKSEYKNYLWNMDTKKVIPLFYDILPGPNLTNKNFLFFPDEENTLVITSINPHRIYKLDIDTGYMEPYCVSTNNKILDYFDPSYKLNLSGGPVRFLDKKCYLAAGHISKKGWGGLRMTFFYTFRDSYPFDILSVSRPVSFGFSDRLEYCNQMFEHEGSLYISIGVDDDFSTLIKLDPENVFNILTSLKDSPTLQFVEVHPGENAFTCDLTKLWGPDVEAEFISEILLGYQKISSTLNSVKPSSVLAINIDKYKEEQVKEAINKAKPQVLLVLGDEWGKCKNYESLFSGVPLVYRQYRFDNYDNPPNVRILPVGYHCWDEHAKRENKFRRKYVWSFIGSMKNDRAENIRDLDSIKPNFHGTTRQEENYEIFNNSIFVYCPKGNYNVESSRPYTASMCGAIPFLLCSNEEWDSLYPYMDIEPPWLHTDNINNMKNEMLRLLKNPDELLRIQQSVYRWWDNIKTLIHSNINNVVVHNKQLGELPLCFKSEHVEGGERIVADVYTNPNSCVLEFGGGSGAVSAIIQKKLNDPSNHVVIQPKEGGMFGGLTNLEKNRDSCMYSYHIIDHILESGEETSLHKLVSKPFDTIICDCEGCLAEEYTKNPGLFRHIKMVQVERDDGTEKDVCKNPSKYTKLLRDILKLKRIHIGDGGCPTEVWVAEDFQIQPRVYNYSPLSTYDLQIENVDYRLSDMVKGHALDGWQGKQWHLKKYPTSIVAQYFNRTDKKRDISMLTNIVRERCSVIPNSIGIILHLRVGDVIEDSEDSVEKLLSEPRYSTPGIAWTQYVSCWNMIEKCLRSFTSKQITIIAGTHNKAHAPKSCQYIDTIKRLLEANDYLVSTRLGHDPDEDFVLMSTAQYFIQSGGGYSKLISDVRKELGLSSCEATIPF